MEASKLACAASCATSTAAQSRIPFLKGSDTGSFKGCYTTKRVLHAVQGTASVLGLTGFSGLCREVGFIGFELSSCLLSCGLEALECQLLGLEHVCGVVRRFRACGCKRTQILSVTGCTHASAPVRKLHADCRHCCWRCHPTCFSNNSQLSPLMLLLLLPLPPPPPRPRPRRLLRLPMLPLLPTPITTATAAVCYYKHYDGASSHTPQRRTMTTTSATAGSSMPPADRQPRSRSSEAPGSSDKRTAEASGGG